jgi:hypothetical protein
LLEVYELLKHSNWGGQKNERRNYV